MSKNDSRVTRITRTEVTIEKRETVTLTTAQNSRGWCHSCREDVSLLPPEVAAGVAGVTTEDIGHAISTHIVHSQKAPNGKDLVCLNSLSSLRRMP